MCFPLPDPGIPTRAPPALSPQSDAHAGRPRAASGCDLSATRAVRHVQIPRRGRCRGPEGPRRSSARLRAGGI